MPDYLFPSSPVNGLPVQGRAELFPVRRVYCIGRNYAAHAVEMGHDPKREAPFFFQKNPGNLNTSGVFPYPPKSSEVHHEIELAAALHSGGRDIEPENALEHVFGYAVSLDMTRRDLQAVAKKAGRPWEIGKAAEHSAPIGPLFPATEAGHLAEGKIELRVNGTVQQTGNLNQMIWKVPEIIAYLSAYFELAAGDVILSGTPSGVGPVVVGDSLEASIAELGSLTVEVIS